MEIMKENITFNIKLTRKCPGYIYIYIYIMFIYTHLGIEKHCLTGIDLLTALTNITYIY